MNPFKRRQPNLPERRQPRQIAPETEGATTFRRGRTLTGSASSLVYAPSETNAALKSSRVQAHELTKTRRRLVTVFFTMCIIAGGFYVLMSQFTAQAVVQASSDASIQLDETYSEAIDGYFSSHISERWRFRTNTDQLTNYVQTKAPEVKAIKIHGSAGFGKTLFEVTFREPIASWDVNSRELFVDGNGIPFGRNYFTAPTLHITDQSGMIAATPGQSIMSNRFMSYIGQVIGLSEEKGYTVTSIVIPEGMTRQIEVHLGGVPYFFKFSSDRPAGEGVEDMARTLQWLKAHDLSPGYVDVRVSGRVFYN